MTFWRRHLAVEQERDHLRLLLQQERERTAELMRTIVELRREGFRHPDPVAITAQPEPDLTEDVLGAIAMRANRDTPEWAHLERQALLLLDQGKDPSDVAQEILNGDDPTDYLD